MWFQSQCTKDVWGTTAYKMMKYWKADHKADIDAFNKRFEKMIRKIIKERGMSLEEFGL